MYLEWELPADLTYQTHRAAPVVALRVVERPSPWVMISSTMCAGDGVERMAWGQSRDLLWGQIT